MEKIKVTEQLANNVRQLMKAMNLSSIELAKRCSISAGTVSKIINGNMSITITLLATICEGLKVPAEVLLEGIIAKDYPVVSVEQESPAMNDLFVAILSINHKRITCIQDKKGNTLGTSELHGDLDLAEPIPSVFSNIVASIDAALLGYKSDDYLKCLHLTVVTQSYEFEKTKEKFKSYLKKYFKSVGIWADWQITYLAAFQQSNGISLVVDKGISLSYRQNGEIKKLGGWKFPIYDLGGENWLGLTVIRHAIEAYEGHVPMSNLAKEILTKFDWKIGNILEFCFKTDKNPDVYCTFYNMLLHSYLTGDEAAKKIVTEGFGFINKLIKKTDETLREKRKIAINGSLTTLYSNLLPQSRLVKPIALEKNLDVLLDIAKQYKK